MRTLFYLKVQSFKKLSWILFFAFQFLFQTTFAQGTGLEGYWVTSIDQPDLKGTLEVQIELKSANSYTGYSQFTYHSQMGYMGSGVENISKNGNSVKFVAAFGEFEGELSSDNKSLKGKMQYIEGSVEFKKMQGQISRQESMFGDFDDTFSDFEQDSVIDGEFSSDYDGFYGTMPMDDYGSSASNDYVIYLIICLVLWLVFIVSFVFYLKARNKRENDGFNITLTGKTSDWVEDIVPIIRIKKRRGILTRDLGLLVHKKSIGLFKKWRRTSIEDLYDAESDKTFLNYKAVSSKRKYYNDDIESIEVSKPSKLGKVRFRIKALNNGKTKLHKLVLPYYETPNLLEFLKISLGERLKLNQQIKLHNIGVLVFMMIFSVLLTVLIALSNISSTEPDASTDDIPLVWIRIAAIVMANVLVLGIPMLIWILDHLPKSAEKNKAKVFKDLSDRRPFRSQWISVILKLLSIAFLIYSIYYLDIGMFFNYIIVGNILFLAHALSQKDPNKLRKNSNKKPILYLRSFMDDRETTLNPRTGFSSTIGIDPPYHFLDQYELNPRSNLYKIIKLVIRYIYNYHPFRLWKLLIGRPIDTSEQQMGNFLSRFGIFMAIGKPGEKIVTTGAARMYVGNDDWQQVVTNLMKESRFIVLQPSRTSGIWWEIEQVLKTVNPKKLLLCMVNYRDFQNDYEDFRLKLKNFLPNTEISKSIGNNNKITFLHFDENWNSFEVKLRYRFALLWPIYGTATNLKATLKPFLDKVGKSD